MSQSKTSRKIQVNLGCGTNLVSGFINVDGFLIPESNSKEVFVKSDIRHLPFDEDSVDYIIADQVLEHIPMADVPQVFHEIRRVLKPGGRAVVIVPDFKSAMQDWLSVDHDLGFNPMAWHWFSEVLYGNQMHEGEFHKTPFTAGYLNYVLNMVGLTGTLVMHPKNGQVPSYPGMRPATKNSVLRNAQLIADITKTK